MAELKKEEEKKEEEERKEVVSACLAGEIDLGRKRGRVTGGNGDASRITFQLSHSPRSAFATCRLVHRPFVTSS